MDYRTEELNGCVIVFGAMPIMDMVGLLERCDSKGMVVGAGVSRNIGANIVMGAPEAIQALKASPEYAALAKSHANTILGNLEVSSAARQWLEYGERGSSSDFMFKRLLGGPGVSDEWNAYPRDPDDLSRCRLLMEQVPEINERFAEIAKCSAQWEALVEAWPKLCEQMDHEAPEWRDGEGKTTGTYLLMKNVLADQR